MKKLVLFLVTMLLVFTLSGCMKQEDYYSKEEVDQLVQDAVDQAVEDLQLTQRERYVMSVMSASLADESFQFSEIGQMINGTVESNGYAYVIIEVEVETEVHIQMNTVAPNGEWDLNIYYGDSSLNEADLNFESIVGGDVFIVTLQPGFNTIEFDSYSDNDWGYSITVTLDGSL